MKILLLVWVLLVACTTSAQLVITPGAQVAVSGNIPLTLYNTDLVNNGSFTATNSITQFSGNTTSVISGSQPIRFFDLQVNKTNSASVVLQRTIAITERILFWSGFLDLNGFNADLGTTGRLDGEQESAHVTGANGGQVVCSVALNAVAGINPANLGLVITTHQHAGQAIVKRGHQPQLNGSGILRYYDISTANNAMLNATLWFSYLDSELNGVNENSLGLFSSNNAINWTDLGFTLKSDTSNIVEKAGIGSFSRFTLSASTRHFPARAIPFSAGPNPVHSTLYIHIESASEPQVMIKVFDSKGVLVKAQTIRLLRGNNQLAINMNSLANGLYTVQVNGNNGELKKTIQVVKQ